MATTAAIIGAASLLGAGLSSAGAASANNRQGQLSYAIEQQRLQDARQNQQYQQALTAMAMNQAQAGYTDAQGSTVTYDPATNTWKTTLGPQAQAQQSASTAADIARNTTDARRAQQANEQALIAAAAARPGAEAARMRAEQYQPIQARDLAGLLETRAATASGDQQRAALQDILRQYARTGTSAAPVITQMQSQRARDLQDSIIQSRIAAMTGTDQINAQRQQALNADAAAKGALTTPNLQYAGITGSNPNAALAALTADRARNATIAAAYGGSNVNKAAELGGAASGATAGAVPNTNLGATGMIGAGNTISGLAGNRNFTDALTKMFAPTNAKPTSTLMGGGFGEEILPGPGTFG